MMKQQTFEGTWEEILQYGPNFSGQRVRLTIVASEETKSQQPVMLDQILKGRVGRIRFQPSNLSARTKEAFADMLADKYKLPKSGQ
ncbi:hypothetical protein VB712_16325 [Spirulina sp. CCNP1310]|nr:hypothetical protein [Spirulina sp. CCNP1310]